MSGLLPAGQQLAIILHVLSLALALLSLVRRVAASQQVLGALGCLRAWVKGGYRREPLDELGKMVCEQMLERKVQQFRRMVQVASCVIALTQAASVFNHSQGIERFQTLPQDALIISVQCIFTCVVLRPSLITPRSLDIYYVCLSLAASLYTAPFSLPPKYLLRTLMISNGCMAALNLCRRTVTTRQVPLFFVCNTLFAAMAISSIYAHGPSNFSHDLMRWVLYWQAMAVCAFSFGPQFLEMGFAASLRRSLRFEEVKELHAAACALLRSFCDCTVELDAQGVITGASEDLGSFLMKGSFSYSLTGTRLCDHISDIEERESFELRLREPKMELVGLAECMPVSMKDSSGNVLRLELLWFQHKRADGQRCFMVGVRELSDHHGSPGPRCSSYVVEEDFFSESGQEMSSVTSDDPGAAILVVDTLTEGFPIRGQTAALTAQLGRLPTHSPLSDYVQGAEQFMAWVQDECLSEQSDKCSVELALPRGHFSAECRILVRASASEPLSGLEEVGLLLTHVNPLMRNPRRRRSVAGTATWPAANGVRSDIPACCATSL